MVDAQRRRNDSSRAHNPTDLTHAAFVIAELSGARPNVFYELGFARALGKAVIHTAYKGTELPFDVYDVPTHFWDSQSELEEKLDVAIDQLTGSLAVC